MRTHTIPARPGGLGVVSITASPHAPMRTPLEGHRVQEMSIGRMLISRSWIDTGDGVHALIRHDSLAGMDAETTARLRATHPGQAHGFCLRQYALVRPASRWRAGTATASPALKQPHGCRNAATRPTPTRASTAHDRCGSTSSTTLARPGRRPVHRRGWMWSSAAVARSPDARCWTGTVACSARDHAGPTGGRRSWRMAGDRW